MNVGFYKKMTHQAYLKYKLNVLIFLNLIESDDYVQNWVINSILFLVSNSSSFGLISAENIRFNIVAFGYLYLFQNMFFTTIKSLFKSVIQNMNDLI